MVRGGGAVREVPEGETPCGVEVAVERVREVIKRRRAREFILKVELTRLVCGEGRGSWIRGDD